MGGNGIKKFTRWEWDGRVGESCQPVPIKATVENGMNILGKSKIIFTQQDLWNIISLCRKSSASSTSLSLPRHPAKIETLSWVSGFKSDPGKKDLASLVWKLGWVAMKRKRGKTCHCCVVKLQVTVLCHKYDHQSQNLFAFKTNSKEKVKSYHFHLTNNHSALLCN